MRLLLLFSAQTAVEQDGFIVRFPTPAEVNAVYDAVIVLKTFEIANKVVNFPCEVAFSSKLKFAKLRRGFETPQREVGFCTNHLDSGQGCFA